LCETCLPVRTRVPSSSWPTASRFWMGFHSFGALFFPIQKLLIMIRLSPGGDTMQWQPIGSALVFDQPGAARPPGVSFIDRVCRAGNNSTNFSIGIDVKSTGSCGGGCLRSPRSFFLLRAVFSDFGGVWPLLCSPPL
jgi:hypothetical protein